MAAQWVIQEILASESDEAEWDCWILGTIEDGYFEEKLRAFDKFWAVRAKAALEWFEAFEAGTVKAPVVPKRVKVRRSK